MLPPAGPLRRYAVIGLIDATGTGLFATVSTLFFTRVVELPVGQVGSSPIRAAYLAQLAGEADRVRARAYNQAVYNSGWAIGGLGAGTALAIGSRQAYLAILTVALPLWIVEHTIGELLQSGGAWGISYGLARPERQGEYLGAFSMGTRIYDTVGPVLAVGLVLKLGVVGWVLMGALLLGISLALMPAVRAAAPGVEVPRSARRPRAGLSGACSELPLHWPVKHPKPNQCARGASESRFRLGRAGSRGPSGSLWGPAASTCG